MKIFITGGSGYLGRNIIRALIARGDTVRGLARSVKSGELIESLGAEVIAGDLNNDEALQNGMDSCDAVIHCAATVTQWGDPIEFHRINVTGTQQVISACVARSIPRLIHISTEAVLANGKPIINADETRPRARKPAGLYPLTKGLAEQAVIQANSDTFSTVALRPRFIWGKDDTVLLAEMTKTINSGGWAWFKGGHYLTSTCHVDNVVEGVLLALDKGEGGEIYFLTDGDPVEFRSFITQMLKTQGVTPPDRNLPRSLAWLVASVSEFIIRRFNLEREPLVTRTAMALMSHEVTVNDGKARAELGYVGTITREAGLADLARRKQAITPQTTPTEA